MANLVFALIFTAVFCCYAEGATRGDFQRAINIQGNVVRGEWAKEIGAAANWDERDPTPAQAACVRRAISPSYGELNRALVLEQMRLRAEDWQLSLPTVSVQQLEAEIKQRLSQAVRPAVDRVVAEINACY